MRASVVMRRDKHGDRVRFDGTERQAQEAPPRRVTTPLAAPSARPLAARARRAGWQVPERRPSGVVLAPDAAMLSRAQTRVPQERPPLERAERRGSLPNGVVYER